MQSIIKKQLTKTQYLKDSIVHKILGLKLVADGYIIQNIYGIGYK
jgi:hypothetical protein